MKKLLIKWALKEIRKLYTSTYFTLEKYGINDMMENEVGGEKELVIYIPTHEKVYSPNNK